MLRNYKVILPIILIILLACGCSEQHKTPTEKEAIQNIKTYLNNKYSRDFEVKIVKFTPARISPYFGWMSWRFEAEVKDGIDILNLTYEESYITENIERRSWSKDGYKYYSDLMSKYPIDGYLEKAICGDYQSPSRVGMTFEEYLDELCWTEKRGKEYLEHSPQFFLDYALFVEKVEDMKIYQNVVLDIDRYLRPKHPHWFSLTFHFVEKIDKDEYIKKVQEYNDLKTKHYGEKSIDYQTYKAMSKPYEEWFKVHTLGNCRVVNNKSFDNEKKEWVPTLDHWAVKDFPNTN